MLAILYWKVSNNRGDIFLIHHAVLLFTEDQMSKGLRHFFNDSLESDSEKHEGTHKVYQ